MDINNIFSNFETNKEKNVDESYIENKQTFQDYMNHPLYWVGMFKKLNQNYNNFNKYIIQSFQKMEEELSEDDLNKAGTFIIYNNSYYYISKINVKDFTCQEALFQMADSELKKYLELSLNYFSENEEYEKCVSLKTTLDFVNLILA
jgi:hypothetical protein